MRLTEEKFPEVLWNESWSPICGHLFWDNDYGANLFCQKLDSKFSSGKITKRTDKPLQSDGFWIGNCLSADDWPSCTGKCNKLQIGGGCDYQLNGFQYHSNCDAGEGASLEIECNTSKYLW